MADIKDTLREFVTYLVKNIVSYPDSVEVVTQQDEAGILTQITVDRADMGAVIGKEGQTAKAIRSLVRIVGSKADVRATVKVNEPK